MKQLIYLPTFILITLSFLLAPVAHAQSSDTPVASASAIKEDINNRIKQAIDKNLKNTQENLLSTSNELVGYSGTIDDIKQNVFTFVTDETTFQVSLSTSSAIIKNTKPLKLELISIKDKALVIGYLTATDIINARRVVIYTNETPKPEKKVILTPIVKIKTNSLILKIDNKDTEVVLDKKLKLDLKFLTTTNKIFGIVSSSTLLQAKIL